jgi:hypothetical protein
MGTDYSEQWYELDDLKTDLAWFDGLGVSEKDAKGFIVNLLESTPTEEVLRECGYDREVERFLDKYGDRLPERVVEIIKSLKLPEEL